MMPKEEALRLGADSYQAGTGESVLRVGSLGDWSFCYEEWGILGGMPGPLSGLSQRTETFSVATDGASMDIFEHWRDGRCTEVFEPDNPDTRLPPPHSWQDVLRERREATGDSEPALVAAVRVIGDHMGAVLDDATLDGPLPTVLLGDGGPLRKPHSGGRGRGVLVPLAEEKRPQ